MKSKPRVIRAWADVGPRSGKIAVISGDTTFLAIYPTLRSARRDMKSQAGFMGHVYHEPIEVAIHIKKSEEVITQSNEGKKRCRHRYFWSWTEWVCERCRKVKP